MTDRERLLDELRPVAFAIAYRMLGSVSEADDVVQETLLRVHQALENGEQIQSRVATAQSRPPRPRHRSPDRASRWDPPARVLLGPLDRSVQLGDPIGGEAPHTGRSRPGRDR
jgi:sigma-70-like protein